MKGRGAGFQPLDGVLGRLLKNKKGLAEGERVGRLQLDWSTVVGQAIANHSAPGYLSGRTLILFVDEAVWLTELNYQRHSLVERINEWAGSGWIAEIRLVQRTLSRPQLPTSAPSSATVDHDLRQRALRATAEVDDEELRQVIAEALALGATQSREDGGD